MWRFESVKCPVHKIEYSVGRDFMARKFYYCKKCSDEKREKIFLNRRVKELEQKLKNKITEK